MNYPNPDSISLINQSNDFNNSAFQSNKTEVYN